MWRWWAKGVTFCYSWTSVHRTSATGDLRDDGPNQDSKRIYVVEETQIDEDPPLQIISSQIICEVIEPIQCYAMSHGDVEVVTGCVDLGKYLERVSSRRIAEQVQLPIGYFFSKDNKPLASV